MISKIWLRNVRLFDRNVWEFQTPELTLLCGTNSSGKSTIAKAIMALAQSQAVATENLSVPGILRLIGSQVDLGSFKQFVSHNNDDLISTIGIEILDTSHGMNMVALRKRLIADPQEASHSITPEQYKVAAQFQFGRRSAIKRHRPLGRADEEAGREIGETPSTQPAELISATFDISDHDSELLSWRISIDPERSPIGMYRLDVPRWAVSGYIPQGALEHNDRDRQDRDRVELRATLKGLLPNYLFYAAAESPKRSNRFDFEIAATPWPIARAIQSLEKVLLSFHYIAPLRAAAKRYYVTNLNPELLVDPVGDNIPYILRDMAQLSVLNCRPKHDEGIFERLAPALNSWLYYLRTGSSHYRKGSDELEVRKTREVLVELSVKSVSGGEAHSLADSGFGYSQVLPVLLQGLIARANSTTFIEQPELHLNPSLQVRLAEFLVAMASLGKQFIVETHSEHLVNMIRVLAAEQKSGSIRSSTKIHYFGFEKKRPKVSSLDIRQDGSVPGWPSDFFGEALTLSGRLLRSQRPNKQKPGVGRD